jgi:hypothetical protein
MSSLGVSTTRGPSREETDAGCDVEIGLVGDGGLEHAAVVLDEIVVDARLAGTLELVRYECLREAWSMNFP